MSTLVVNGKPAHTRRRGGGGGGAPGVTQNETSDRFSLRTGCDSLSQNGDVFFSPKGGIKSEVNQNGRVTFAKAGHS